MSDYTNSTGSANNADLAAQIGKSLQKVREQINSLATKHKRAPGDITLLAVSKTKPIEAIRAAIAAGQHAFGENYPDEAIEKIRTVHTEMGMDKSEWHFIGAIQSRKARALAQNFSWVHSVDRLKVAKKLSEHRPPDLPPLNICLQVNIDNEPTKSGVLEDELTSLAAECAALPGLQLRGLMAIPAPQENFDAQRAAFARLRTCLNDLKATHTGLDTLSMGMSGDLEAAIAEGATIVRVGTAIFGARAPKQP